MASASQLKEDYKDRFNKIYNFKLSDEQFCFIDNNIDEDSEMHEK